MTLKSCLYLLPQSFGITGMCPWPYPTIKYRMDQEGVSTIPLIFKLCDYITYLKVKGFSHFFFHKQISFVFETGFHIAQAGLKLLPRMT